MNKAHAVFIPYVLALFGIFCAVSSAFAAGQTVQLEGGKNYEIYVVKKGDTVWKIAERFLQDPNHWRSIIVPDRFVSTNPNLIQPGQLLLVPSNEMIVERIVEFGRTTEGTPAQPEKRKPGAVAVAKLKNGEDDRGYDWLGTGLAESLVTDLKKTQGVRLVERAQIEEVVRQNKIDETFGAGEKEVRDLGKKLRADSIITGVYHVVNGNVDIELQLLDADNGKKLDSVRVSGPLDRIFELERLLLIRLVDKSMDLVDDSQAAFLGGEKTTLNAFEQASRGKALFYAGQTREARAFYQKALEADPKYQAAFDDLKASVSTADTMAIMPFKNATGDLGLEWLGLGFSEALSTDLHKLTSIFLVERSQIEKSLGELKWGLTGAIDERTAPKLGKMVGASIMLVGSYQVVNTTIRADVRLVDVVSSQVLMSETVTGSMDKIFDLELQLADKVAQAFHLTMTEYDKKKMAGEKPDIESFKRSIMAKGNFEVISKDPAKAAKVKTVALVNFENTSKNPEYTWLTSAIPGALTSELKVKSRLDLVERLKINKALEEMQLAQLGLIPQESASKLGMLVGADAVLTGIYQLSGDSIRIDAKVIRVETGEVLSGCQVEGPFQNLFDLERKLADDIVVALNAAAQVAAPKKEKKEEPSSAQPAKGDPESLLLAKRAYKFEIASGQSNKTKFLLQEQKNRSDIESLNKVKGWITTVRSLTPSTREAQVLGLGESVPFAGFLFTREDVNKIQFLKDERDLCLETFDKKLSNDK